MTNIGNKHILNLVIIIVSSLTWFLNRAHSEVESHTMMNIPNIYSFQMFLVTWTYSILMICFMEKEQGWCCFPIYMFCLIGLILFSFWPIQYDHRKPKLSNQDVTQNIRLCKCFFVHLHKSFSEKHDENFIFILSSGHLISFILLRT